MMLNDYHYYTLIKPHIPIKYRVICCKNDLLDIPRIRILNTNYLMLMAQIKLHTGTPCDRYCICRHFDNEDFIRYYHQVT